jgi:mono/diheme cytochrome c family protein
MKIRRASIWPVLAVGLLFVNQSQLAAADDTPKAEPAKAATDTIDPQQKSDARAIFAAQCSWCHGDYGMKADKAPKLAGTQMTKKEVEARIRDGKSGSMPSFRKFLDDSQIDLMARYIKSLQP